jgi:energy-coupling factor transport system permease protein
MEARCYRGGEHRTRLNELCMEKKDYIAILVIAVYIFIVVMTRYINII